jgi:hypothetical protein
MKHLKEGIQGSVLPVKLFTLYVLALTSVIGLNDGPVAGVFGLGFPDPEDFAESFAGMLALSPALLAVLFLAAWNINRMPIFTALFGSVALWLSWIIWKSYWPGFDSDFPNYFNMIGLLWVALVFAVPFVFTYILWRFWTRN